MRVMQIIGSKKAGGAEAFYVRLIGALRNNIEILPVVKTNSWLDKRLTDLEIPHKTAEFGGMFDFKTKAKLECYAEEFKPDVIQSWMNRSSKFMPQKTKAVKVARMGGYYNLKYYKKMDYIVGNTQGICDYVRKNGWQDDKVVYLPNFADEPMDIYTDKHEELSTEIKKEFNIPENAFVLMVAGRLHENKGIDTAISAVKKVADAHLIIVGDGELENKLKTQVKELNLTNRIHFAGWADVISPYCAASDVWLVSSRHEPLGNVVLDAWMHNLPVIATKSAGPVSLIEDGEDGLLVPIDDIDAMAKAIDRLDNAPTLCARLAENGYKKGINDYGREVVIADYLDFYEQIIKAN